MNSVFGAYLEDYNKIKIIIPLDTKYNTILLSGNGENQILNIDKIDVFAGELHIYSSYSDDILLHLDYYIIINDNLKFHLNLGKITRSSRFDEEFYYDGPLGVSYTKKTTTFRVWSPVCKEVILVLNDLNYPLSYISKGLWEIKVNGNLENYKYYYNIRVNDSFDKIIDPYGISLCSNALYNYVIDLDNTYQSKYNYIDNSNKKIVYEINFRDLCNDIHEFDSLYLKAVEKLDYIKNLNITHLQLMPSFCFGGVDEKIKDSSNPNFLYNWGYNPVSYMVPSGWFSSDADSPIARINELKEFIDEAHKRELGVNMDVVFNHVYIHETFSLGKLIPGYVYRTDDRGFLMNSSYCGNDLRTEALMIRRFIIDTIKYFKEVFKVDGFRFDLMGLIDNDTMLEVKKTVKDGMLYGEGWYMNTTKNMNDNANLGSAKKLYPVAFFNDYYRNIMSGKMNGRSSFITGDKIKPEVLKNLLCNGSLKVMPFKSSSQSINYIECHDNYTFYDKCKYLFNIDKEENIIDYCKLGLGLVILSDGISFIHSGEELCRSKQGNDNSYNLSDDINSIDFNKINTSYDLTNYLKNIIYISKDMDLSTGRCFYDEEHYEIRYKYDNYQVIIKNNYEEEDKYFVPGTTLIFNNGFIEATSCESLHLTAPGIWILKKY